MPCSGGAQMLQRSAKQAKTRAHCELSILLHFMVLSTPRTSAPRAASSRRARSPPSRRAVGPTRLVLPQVPPLARLGRRAEEAGDPGSVVVAEEVGVPRADDPGARRVEGRHDEGGLGRVRVAPERGEELPGFAARRDARGGYGRRVGVEVAGAPVEEEDRAGPRVEERDERRLRDRGADRRRGPRSVAGRVGENARLSQAPKDGNLKKPGGA